MYQKSHKKLIYYEDIPKRHDKILLKKTMNQLKDKYRNLIRERNFNMNCFEQRVIKEIRKLTYFVLPNYDSFFIKIEKIFVKEISNCYNIESNDLLSPPSVHDMLRVHNYRYNLHFPIGKVTLRNIVENEKELAPVDKYLQVQDRYRAISKNERRINYSNKILNNLPKVNFDE